MSAIAGIVCRAPLTDLYPALEAMAHYGGDGMGLWLGEGVALGQQTRFVSPEDSDTQPLTVGALTIVADARLDNRDDLFAQLTIPHTERSHTTDATLILAAYAKWGADCPRFLIGDYAFAIWDAREQMLFCARDHIGVKPFYYYYANGVFAFATDINGLLAIVPGEIDEAHVFYYLTAGTHHTQVSPTDTFFRDIYKLRYAHTLTLRRDTPPRLAAYWTPENVPAIRYPTFEAYAEALYALLETAVKSRLRTSYPLGAHISGGIDSSSLAVLAIRLLRAQGRPPPTLYSWSPPPSDNIAETEHRRTEAIARQEGVSIVYTGEFPRPDLRGADISRQPTNTLAPEIPVQQHARGLGIRRMISGWGGDEWISFNGRGRLAEALIRGQWIGLARKTGIDNGLYCLLKHRDAAPLRAALERLRDGALLPLLPDSLYRQRAEQRARLRLLQPEFLARYRAELRPLIPPARTRHSMAATMRGLYHAGHVAARMEDWYAAGGIEYVFPLTDRRIMEFAFGIPTSLHIGRVNGTQEKTRFLFIHAVRRLLPPEMVWDTHKCDTALFNAEANRTPAEILSTDSDCPWVNAEAVRELAPELNRVAIRARHALAIWRARNRV